MDGGVDRRVGLTRRQTLFWLDEQLFPGAPYHHIAVTVRLEGPLDRMRLEEAFLATQRDVDLLRLVIEVDDGRPVQRVRPEPSLVIEDVDLSADPSSFERWRAERAARPFDLASGLHRAALVTLSETSRVFCLFLHHIATDGASIAFLVDHLAARYAGRPVVARPSFLDYVEAEHAYRTSASAAKHEAYWTAKLAGGTPPLSFYGRPRESLGVEATRLWADGGTERLRRLEERGAEEPIHLINPAVSRLVAMATVLFAFLHRVTGNRKLAIGTPVPNRTARFLDTCGLLMEQVFLTVTIDEAETFATLAEKVRHDVFASFRHAQHCVSDRGLEYVTLNLLTQRFGSFGDLGAKVRIQAACTMPELSLPEAKGDGRNTFGIQLHDFEGDDRLLVGFDLHRDTFEPELRRRIPGHFFRLLDALLADPSTRIDSVDLLDDEERTPLLVELQGSDAGGPPDDVLEPIRASMRRRADHPAVVASDGSVSYAALERRVNALARALVRLGVGRETLVGLCLERGADEVTALLATLEAGGAYVPLDATHPRERSRIVLEDAAPPVLVAHASQLPALDVPEGTRVVVLDRDWPEILAGDTSPLGRSHDPEQLAYVLFTSGSTGRPKGVEIPRRALANFLRSMAHTPGLGPSDRLLAVTTTTFDIAALELLLPLHVGATVRVADRDGAADPASLRRLLETEPITVLQATPTAFRLLVEAGWQGDPSIRLFVGGEPLSPELATALVRRSGALFDLYGPTETTVWSTVKRIDDPSRITIGRPIDRTQAYVLDADGHVVPRGVVGQLAIGGDGLARGYRGRPELTASRFVRNRYGREGDRVHLTGDLARQLPDGELACLGRIDDQVKIRGFRIELGEIESVLRGVPGVREVAVAARPAGTGEPVLVAYHVADEPIARERFVAALRAKLPLAMHPSVFVRLEALPVTPNGKLDRLALPPPPELPRSGTLREPRRPRDDREARMVSLFRAVLGVDDLGIDEDFFSLGGTSPQAIELRRRIESDFDVELPLRELFEHPTPVGLLERLGVGSDADAPIVVRLREGPPERTPLFCLLGVQLYDELARSLAEPRTVYGLHVPVRFVPSRETPPSIAEIASRYVDLVRAIRPHGPYAFVGLCFGGVIAFEVARRLRESGEIVERVAILDAVLPGAVSRDEVARLRSLARRAVEESERIPVFLRERSEGLLHRLPPSRLRRWLASWLAREGSELRSDAPIDLPLAGPRVAAQYAAFERSTGFLDAEVLVFRATVGPTVPGVQVAEHCGFRGMARDVVARALPADHLGLLRPPHVEAVARALDSAPSP